ncbi:MAG: rane-bound dehydrogenase domain protein [Verrucomicrobiales bacterium]|nr:rane-bound dehydrogenase domain protein [Verrucomicrobiales bacterium]
MPVPDFCGDDFLAKSSDKNLFSFPVLKHTLFMPIPLRTVFAPLFSFVLLVTPVLAQQNKQLTETEQNYIAVEALNRIQGDIRTNVELKAAVYNVLPKVRGTQTFVRLVKKFELKDQHAILLEMALAHSGKDIGVQAAQLILDQGGSEMFREALSRTNHDSFKAAEVLGNVKENRVVPLLSPVLTDNSRENALRKVVVHSLAQTQDGAAFLLKLAKEGTLAESLKFTASSELNSVRWLKIKAEAEQILPPLQGNNTQPFPSVATLAKMKGNAANGEKVFGRETVMCSRCHEVRSKGGQIGPALSEIGSKLGREALIESVLDPSAGISFGFEAFNITLKNGDDAYGLIASETADELAVKDLNGLVTRYKKSDIAKRDQMKTSIMPTGLQQTMSPQDFVDLIEYLSSLKKIEEAKK